VDELILNTNIQVVIRRDDLIHPIISGNKYRKLKYNIEAAKLSGTSKLLTFGGAFSNHIAATAFAGNEFGLETIGIIRGEELAKQKKLNPTLEFAQSCGMNLKFVSREAYKHKLDTEFLGELKSEFGTFYLLPEGGTNDLAVKGCEEILTGQDEAFDIICCCVGTGGTISGLINSSFKHQKVLGFPALKGDFLRRDIRKFVNRNNWELISDYHFDGYAKIKPELITFINEFKRQYNIPLDPIYTGKMMYGIFDLIEKNYFPSGTKILVIHSGGLQGIKGMNLKLEKKGWPLIE
jgi:1-aminocyclopropane-1-carboxylate deaminase